MLEITHEDLGKLLRTWREKKGITQVELSFTLGYKYNVVCSWENGTGRIRPENLQKVVDLLEIPLDHLKSYQRLWSRLS